MQGIEKLPPLLDRILAVHEKLLELEQRKTETIVRSDVEALDKMLLSEQSLVMEATALEEQRMALEQELGLADMSLEDIAGTYDQNQVLGLRERHAALREVLPELQKANRLNMSVLNAKLMVIDQLMAVTGRKDTALTYERPSAAKR